MAGNKLTSGMVTFHPDLEPLLAPIDSVRPHVDNPNNGDVDAIRESIEISGMYRPVYAQRSTGYLLAGNHTWTACKSLDATVIPVVWLDVDDLTAVRILLADNRIAALAVPDEAATAELLSLLAEQDSLLGTGYTDGDLAALQAVADIPLEYDEYATWPSIMVRVPPHVRAAYLAMTNVAVGDRERFELLMRLAGWDGKKPKDKT